MHVILLGVAKMLPQSQVAARCALGLAAPPDFKPDQGICPYRAAAKLQLGAPGSYDLVELYGMNPADDPDNIEWHLGCQTVLYNTDVQRLREIEVDTNGKLFVLSAHALNANDWLLTYQESGGTASEQRINLTGTVRSPASMLASAVHPDKLYLASSINDDTTAELYRFTIEAEGLTPDGTIEIDGSGATSNGMGFGHIATITAVNENPSDGTLYVTGFTTPRFDPDLDPNDPLFEPGTGSVLAAPMLAVVPPGATAAVASKIACHDLSLPISAAWVLRLPEDLDGDGDVDLDDYEVFAACLTGPRVIVPADGDEDGDVDLDDFAAWPPCLAGPGVTVSEGCRRMDLDADWDVDLSDLGGFQVSFTGSGGPLPPECQSADFDTDEDVDLGDFAEFQVVFTGP